jgi:beta-N-acetylhexosaminidase
MPEGRTPHRPGRARRVPCRRALWGLVAAGAVLASAACTGTSNAQVEVRAATQERAARTTTTVPLDCAQMLPVEGQAAQLMMAMVTTPQLAADVITSGRVGGFGLKGNQSKDVGSQVADAVKDAPLPVAVAADEEGGTVQRLRLALGTLPAAATLAKGTPEDAATTVGEHAAAMKKLGFTMDFAPVADVGSGSGLGTRSFGTDPQKVSSFIGAIVPAIKEAGVIPVVKHWPGIGGGGSDPHLKLPTLAPIDTLRTKDLIPFDKAIAVGAPAIMVTHAAVPGLTQAGEPASLSAAAITGELRGRQKFDGLVITDSLGMGAVAKIATQSEAAEKAIAAGADIALVSGADAVPAAHARLVEAISTGRIPQQQVLASVRRVLASKGIEGECLDAVAKYSAVARQASSTTVASDPGSGTVDTGINDGSGTGNPGSGTGTGTGSSTSLRTTTTLRSPTTTVRSATTVPRSTTTTGG